MFSKSKIIYSKTTEIKGQIRLTQVPENGTVGQDTLPAVIVQPVNIFRFAQSQRVDGAGVVAGAWVVAGAGVVAAGAGAGAGTGMVAAAVIVAS